MKSFLIWGAGGHGKVVADLLRALGHRVVGFVDSDPGKLNRRVDSGGAAVVMLQGTFLERLAAERELPEGIDAVAVAMGDNQRRLECLARLDGRSAPALVHPTAVVSPSASLGAGTVVFAGAVINADARIGAAVIVNTAAVVEHDCLVADGAHVSPGATLAGAVRVGERSWIGAGATIIQEIEVGSDAVVGAGAVVIRDVAMDTVVAGVPAAIVGSAERRRGDRG